MFHSWPDNSHPASYPPVKYNARRHAHVIMYRDLTYSIYFKIYISFLHMFKRHRIKIEKQGKKNKDCILVIIFCGHSPLKFNHFYLFFDGRKEIFITFPYSRNNNKKKNKKCWMLLFVPLCCLSLPYYFGSRQKKTIKSHLVVNTNYATRIHPHPHQKK